MSRVFPNMEDGVPDVPVPVCHVTMRDYLRHWTKDALSAVRILPAPYAGPERRLVLLDRRSGTDRRWDGTSGRRYRLADRRWTR